MTFPRDDIQDYTLPISSSYVSVCACPNTAEFLSRFLSLLSPARCRKSQPLYTAAALAVSHILLLFGVGSDVLAVYFDPLQFAVSIHNGTEVIIHVKK